MSRQIDDRFHLHIVDSGDAAAPVNAAVLFAHLSLRCGRLHDHVVLSASTSHAAERVKAMAETHAAVAGGGSGASASAIAKAVATHDISAQSDDTAVLREAAKLLVCESDGMIRGGETGGSAAPTLSFIAPADPSSVMVPYKYLSSTFAAAEQSLTAALATVTTSSSSSSSDGSMMAPYFDCIATTDLASYEYISDYYQYQRLVVPPACWSSLAGGSRRERPLALVHIVCADPSRTAQLLQRLIESLLKVDDVDAHAGASAVEAAGRQGGSWVDGIDEVSLQYAQLLGVDVLATVL